MTDEVQLEMDLGDDDDNGELFVENLTLTADKVLYNNLGRFHHVLIIGTTDEETVFCTDLGNVPFWMYHLRRCEEFLMRNAT